MRIISGQLRGRRLPSPVSRGIRPTTDRVREAVFSALGHAVEASQVLDLFAGTGSFGFEALSRGAASVVFVETDRQMAARLTASAELFGVLDQVEVLVMDATRAVKKLLIVGSKFGIIFLDPPYEAGLVQNFFSDMVFPNLLSSDGLLIVESGDLCFKQADPAIFEKKFGGKYGGTHITILRLRTEAR